MGMRVIESTSAALSPGTTMQASATHNPLPTDSADAIDHRSSLLLRDSYADLSDFFYVWLKRRSAQFIKNCLNLKWPLKDEQFVALSARASNVTVKRCGMFRGEWRGLRGSRRVSEPTALVSWSSQTKRPRGWEAMIGALIEVWLDNHGFLADRYRNGGRLRARNSAALASSVHLICRPRTNIRRFCAQQ